MRKSVIVSAIAIVLPLLAICPNRLNAQTAGGSPTLQQTSDWLAKTFYDYGGVGAWHQRVIDFQLDNSCILSFKVEAPASQGVNEEEDSYSIPLGAVTRVDGDVSDDRGNRGMVFYTGTIAAIHEYISGSNQKTFAKNQESFIFSNMPAVQPGAEMPQTPRQMIPRIITALQHAVSLCQGTYQAPAQANQPF